MEIIRKGTFSRCTLKKLSQHVFCLAENLCFIKEDMQTLRITENYPQKNPKSINSMSLHVVEIHVRCIISATRITGPTFL